MNKENLDFGKKIEELIVNLKQLQNRGLKDNLMHSILKLGNKVEIITMIENDKDFSLIEFDNIPDNQGVQHLPAIIDGIKKKKVLEIYYQPFYEEKPYFIRVHPYLLKEYLYRWYLIGLNDIKNEIRTFGMDRIWEIKETDLKYIPNNLTARDYFKNTVGIISPKGEPPWIKLLVYKPQAHYLLSQPLHPSQNIESETENSITFKYKVHPTYEFKAQLMSLGSDLKVLEPVELKVEIINELKKTLKEYQSE